MDDSEFQALVRELETQARAAPEAYRQRVVLFGLLGYAFIGLVLLVLAGLGGVCALIISKGFGAAGIKLAIPVVAGMALILRALAVRFDPPRGIRILRASKAELTRQADALARTLDAPLADIILLTQDYNASIAQIPRFGILGFPRNYLCVGSQLLAMLPATHVRAVLAHEFAHLSRAHGNYGAWCYRVRATWVQLLVALERDDHWSAGVFKKFFAWYVPRFNALTFVMMRQHEFEADRLAAEIVGRREMAQTLVDLEVRGAALATEFWPNVHREANETASPPYDLVMRLVSTARYELNEDAAATMLRGVLQRPTDPMDTHPSLKERLAALDGLGEQADVVVPPTPRFDDSAFQSYLGSSYAQLAETISKEWRDGMAAPWKARYDAVQAARQGLAALKDKPELQREERYQQALWTEELEGSDAAFALYDSLMQREPTYAPVCYAVGRILLGRDDASGLALVDKAMELDGEAVLPGCELIVGYLMRHDRLDDAAAYRERAGARLDLVEAARHERLFIKAKDSYLPAEFPPETIRAIVEKLDSIADVKLAYLARKVVQHFSETAPLHVLVVVPDWSLFSLRSEGSMRESARRISESLYVPAGTTAFVLNRKNKAVLEPLAGIDGARIYDAKQRTAERR